MHKELLSDAERDLLKEYLSKGKTGDNMRVLRYRINKNYAAIKNDFDLISKAKESFKQSP
mgnify:CR=1 FL=1